MGDAHMSKYNEAQKKAYKKYQQSKATVNMLIDKEQKERYKKHAENLGVSLTELFCNLIEADIERHEQGNK